MGFDLFYGAGYPRQVQDWWAKFGSGGLRGVWLEGLSSLEGLILKIKMKPGKLSMDFKAIHL